jgi:hypothetical protein
MPTATLEYPPDVFDVDTDAPYKRTVGHEVELDSGSEVTQILYDKGLTQDDHLHDYHCRCGTRYAIHCTEDGTAPGGEHLIGGPNGVVFGSQLYLDIITAFSDAAIDVGCTTSDGVGMHTHVGIGDLSDMQKRLLVRNYLALQSDILDLASGRDRNVRNNGNTSAELPDRYYITSTDDWTKDIHELAHWSLPGRPTLNFHTGHSTVEFRVWNSSVVAWRMYLAGGISTALTQASLDGHVAGAPGDNSLFDFLYDYMTSDLRVLVQRQLTFKKEVYA